MNKKHLYLIAFILLVSYGCYIVYSMYNKPHKIISEQTVDYRLTVDEMIKAYTNDETTAIATYIDKVVVLEGTLKSITASESSLSIAILEGENGLANCEFCNTDLNLSKSPNPGDKVFIKGLFIGYDDLLGELQLKKCTIIPADSQH